MNWLGKTLLVVIVSIVLVGLLGYALGVRDDPVEDDERVACFELEFGGKEFVAMSEAEYAQRLREVGCSEEYIAHELANFEVNQAGLRRWQEAEEHWMNIDAFAESAAEVSEDRVIDLPESSDLCYKAGQWREQLEAAREYVAAYREVEPELVASTPRLHRLETEADRALVVVATLEEDCQ